MTTHSFRALQPYFFFYMETYWLFWVCASKNMKKARWPLSCHRIFLALLYIFSLVIFFSLTLQSLSKFSIFNFPLPVPHIGRSILTTRTYMLKMHFWRRKLTQVPQDIASSRSEIFSLWEHVIKIWHSFSLLCTCTVPDTKVPQSHTRIHPIVWFKLFWTCNKNLIIINMSIL